MKRCFSFLAAVAVAFAPAVSAQFVTDLPADQWVTSQPTTSQTTSFVDCTTGDVVGDPGLTSFFRNTRTGAIFGQSFTSPCDGQLDELLINVYNQGSNPASETGSFDLVMLEGAGGTGTLVASENFTIASPTTFDSVEERVLALTDSYPVAEGEVYTLFFNSTDDNTLQIVGNNAAGYDGGALYITTTGDIADAEVFISGTTGGEFDLTFELSFEASPVASEAGPEGAVISIGSLMPNPAIAVARLPFTLQSASDVRLSVYDVLGREVSVLAEGSYGPGTHVAPMDASDLAAGTYVARLVSEDAVVTRTITVVR